MQDYDHNSIINRAEGSKFKECSNKHGHGLCRVAQSMGKSFQRDAKAPRRTRTANMGFAIVTTLNML